MSVGGKVIQVYKESSDRMWVNTVDTSGEPCAVFVVPDQNHPEIKLGDTLWWQAGKAYLTPKDATSESETVVLTRIGFSGVNHPLGKEYQIGYDLSKILDQTKSRLNMAESMLQEWLQATPTSANNEYCPINQPQAWKTAKLLPIVGGQKKSQWDDEAAKLTEQYYNK